MSSLRVSCNKHGAIREDDGCCTTTNQSASEDLNWRIDQLVEMIRKGVPLLPMKEIHLKKKKMFIKEEGEVILEQDRHNNMLQEGQFMLKLLKVKNMMMPLKNQISTHIGEHPTLHMQEIHTR